MTDPAHAPFLATICERPFDDGPRLVYADWLEEQGDSARAEFIRVQCELANLEPEPRTFIVNLDSFAGFRGEFSTVIQRTDDMPIQDGERINIEFFQGKSGRYRKRFDSLLVISARAGRLGGGAVNVAVELKMDEQSVPWPGTALRARERELLRRYKGLWLERDTGGTSVTYLNKEANEIVRVAVAFGDAREVDCDFSRGFLSRIAAPAALLWGGPCERCERRIRGGQMPPQQMWQDIRDEQQGCPDCGGIGRPGRTTGIGAELFRFNPITEVEVVGAEPWQSPIPNEFHWVKSSASSEGVHPPSDVSDDIWNLIEGETRNVQKIFPTLTAARAALSRAIVDHYREANGYPALTQNKEDA